LFLATPRPARSKEVRGVDKKKKRERKTEKTKHTPSKTATCLFSVFFREWLRKKEAVILLF
jgi:hypothetical protein